MQFTKKHEWSMSAITYTQLYTFSNRCAFPGSDLEDVCVCLCVNTFTHVYFPGAKLLSVTERGRVNISMIHFAKQHFFSSIHPRNRMRTRAVMPFPSCQSFFPFWPVLDSLKHLLTVKPNCLMILLWQKQKEESSACSNMLLINICSL